MFHGPMNMFSLQLVYSWLTNLENNFVGLLISLLDQFGDQYFQQYIGKLSKFPSSPIQKLTYKWISGTQFFFFIIWKHRKN